MLRVKKTRTKKVADLGSYELTKQTFEESNEGVEIRYTEPVRITLKEKPATKKTK